MKDENIVLDNYKTEIKNTERKITSLEAAKELRSILPYCKQISALRKYLYSYMDGDYSCSTPGYALMIDKMAKQFGIKACTWLMGRVEFENQERYGKRLLIDEFPKCLLLDPGEGRSLEDICIQIMAEEDYLLRLKNRILYIADKKEELQYGKTGYDPIGDKYWQCVTWQKRNFLIPATAEAIATCRNEGNTELPSYMTSRPPIGPYKRSSALQSALTIEKYNNQNKRYLKEFED